ncbi:MAG: hypothetical protein KAT04_06175 [Methylococcales bacterium]|nr:hypothetical protein [Methylococcales bacterium]
MGMFDSIRTPCPSCGKELEFQTKGGECVLATYPLDKVPSGAAEYVVGEMEHCSSCNVVFEINLMPHQVLTVKMRLTRVGNVNNKEPDFTPEEIEALLVN